jgi:hypothetical protein
MTASKKLISMALAGLAMTIQGAAQATPSTSPEDRPGLLGKRHIGVSLATTDFRNSNVNNAVTSEVFADIPVNQHISVGGGYSLSRLSDNGFTGYWNDLFTDVTAYTTINGFKPFVDAGIGYSMFNLSGNGISTDDQNGFYGAGAGVELPITKALSVALRTGFSDTMTSGAKLFWHHSIHSAYWVSPRVAATGTVSFNESVSITYAVGARFVF